MNVDEFLLAVGSHDLQIRADGSSTLMLRPPESIDTLFHIPLLALTLMTLLYGHELPSASMGRNVASVLTEHFITLKKTPHALETSITLRRRCADALVFLEAVGLVSVADEQTRMLNLTEAGRERVSSSLRDTTDLGLLARQLRIARDRAAARTGSDGRQTQIV